VLWCNLHAYATIVNIISGLRPNPTPSDHYIYEIDSLRNISVHRFVIIIITYRRRYNLKIKSFLKTNKMFTILTTIYYINNHVYLPYTFIWTLWLGKLCNKYSDPLIGSSAVLSNALVFLADYWHYGAGFDDRTPPVRAVGSPENHRNRNRRMSDGAAGGGGRAGTTPPTETGRTST